MTQWKEATSNGTITIDPTVHVYQNAYLDYSGNLTIDAHADIGENTMVYTHTHQFTQPAWRDLPSEYQAKTIAHHVFIGPNCFITANCTRIGEHSVIGANSVVTKDVPAYEIWAGNPAHKIKEVDHL